MEGLKGRREEVSSQRRMLRHQECVFPLIWQVLGNNGESHCALTKGLRQTMGETVNGQRETDCNDGSDKG